MQSYEELYPCAGDSLSDSTLFYHRLVETFKFAFSMRMHLGDSDFDNVTDVINNLTSNHFIDEVIEKIDDKQTYNSSSNHYDPQVGLILSYIKFFMF
jgi:gamma-glutamyltranspeptidase